MKDNKEKTDWQKLAKQVAVCVVLFGIAYVGKVTYDYIYKQGYQAGAANQLVCAAGERDATLKTLCK